MAECCLSIGIYARRCGQMPCSPYDGDNHVVTEIFDRKRKKWIALDPTYGSYFRMEVSAVLNRQNPNDIEKLQKRNAGINWYYAKNSYYFFFDSVSAFGISAESVTYYVVPKGFSLRRQRIRAFENWKVMYGMDVEDRIAKTKARTFHIASAAL